MEKKCFGVGKDFGDVGDVYTCKFRTFTNASISKNAIALLINTDTVFEVRGCGGGPCGLLSRTPPRLFLCFVLVHQ